MTITTHVDSHVCIAGHIIALTIGIFTTEVTGTILGIAHGATHTDGDTGDGILGDGTLGITDGTVAITTTIGVTTDRITICIMVDTQESIMVS